jgi:DNA-binding response OmpR family regulator
VSHKVLIVDDEANIVISLEFLMKQAGYRVDIARTGDEALAMIDQFAPDLILLDVMLPGVNGFDILQRIRQEPQHARMAVILLTAKGRDVEVTKGLALGANAYITKPFSTHELLAEVRRCLDEAQNHEALTN